LNKTLRKDKLKRIKSLNKEEIENENGEGEKKNNQAILEMIVNHNSLKKLLYKKLKRVV